MPRLIYDLLKSDLYSYNLQPIVVSFGVLYALSSFVWTFRPSQSMQNLDICKYLLAMLPNSDMIIITITIDALKKRLLKACFKAYVT